MLPSSTQTDNRLILFINKSFSAHISGNGDKEFSITPIVTETYASCGIGLMVNNQIFDEYGSYLPRDTITGWRATRLLLAVNWKKRTWFRKRIKWSIDENTLSQFYHAAMRKTSDEDRAQGRNTVISMIGKKEYDNIFRLPIPETIISTIFEGQTREPKLCVCPLRAEILAGTVPKQERFQLLGIH